VREWERVWEKVWERVWESERCRVRERVVRVWVCERGCVLEGVLEGLPSWRVSTAVCAGVLSLSYHLPSRRYSGCV
jgi:hypothetical protein